MARFQNGRGRGQGRSGGRGNPTSTKNSDDRRNSSNKELKFYLQTPQYKEKFSTYASVKSHIVEFVKKTCKFGNDIGEALDNILTLIRKCSS